MFRLARAEITRSAKVANVSTFLARSASSWAWRSAGGVHSSREINRSSLTSQASASIFAMNVVGAVCRTVSGPVYLAWYLPDDKRLMFPNTLCCRSTIFGASLPPTSAEKPPRSRGKPPRNWDPFSCPLRAQSRAVCAHM